VGHTLDLGVHPFSSPGAQEDHQAVQKEEPLSLLYLVRSIPGVDIDPDQDIQDIVQVVHQVPLV